jgi:hypothetical protein
MAKINFKRILSKQSLFVTILLVIVTNILSLIYSSPVYAADSWSTGNTGGTGRNGQTSVLYNGKIYFWGGMISGGSMTNTLDIYDIATDFWTTGTAGGTARMRHTSHIYNGKIYSWGGFIANGTRLNTMDIYDIATNSWSTGTTGGTARNNHVSILYNGKIYYWAGVNSTPAITNTLDIYDIATNSWSTGTTGGTARTNANSIAYNGKMYSWAGSIIGSKLNTIDIFDIASNSWTTGTAGGTARSNHSSVEFNGKVYSWAGYNASSTEINTLDIYNIATNAWSTGTAGGTARSSHSSIVHNGKIYSWGGNFLNTLDIYDTDTRLTTSLDSPSNTTTNESLFPIFKTTAVDLGVNYLKYKIQLCTDVSMTTSCQTFDQTANQTGWGGQNTQENTAYTSGTQATYTPQSALAAGTTYYWRSYFIDPAGSSSWSATQTAPFSFTTAWSDTSTPSTPTCANQTPATAPDLFQINISDTSSKLYYSPATGNIDRYFIAYSGINSNAEEHGVEYSQGYSGGVLSIDINFLKPNTAYYFKVRAGNGCMTGHWSTIMKVKTTSSKNLHRIYYKYLQDLISYP